MAHSKAKLKIVGDKTSPCGKHLEAVKFLQVKSSVYTLLCRVIIHGVNIEWPYLPFDFI